MHNILWKCAQPSQSKEDPIGSGYLTASAPRPPLPPPGGKVAAKPTEEGGRLLQPRRIRDAPTQPPLVILSKLVAGKAPWQTARYACRSPAAPAAPLPKKFFDTFWEPYFKPARTEGSLKIKIILVIPTEQSEWRDLVLNEKAVPNTALHMASPPRGEAGAKRLMRGNRPYFRRSG